MEPSTLYFRFILLFIVPFFFWHTIKAGKRKVAGGTIRDKRKWWGSFWISVTVTNTPCVCIYIDIRYQRRRLFRCLLLKKFPTTPFSDVSKIFWRYNRALKLLLSDGKLTQIIATKEDWNQRKQICTSQQFSATNSLRDCLPMIVIQRDAIGRIMFTASPATSSF